MSKKTNFIFNFPEDISTHIFLKLPAKSLLTCTCVCKSWNSFISSPAFFSSHLKLTEENNAHLCLLQRCTVPVKTGKDSFFLHSKDRDFIQQDLIHFPYSAEIGFQVLTSCNGLVLLLHGRYNTNPMSLILWNPLIRKSMIIYEGHNLDPLEAVGLGLDMKTGDYKALTIIEELRGKETTLVVNLYSLKANSWKRLPDIEAANDKMLNLHRGMTYLNGAIYFVLSRRMFKKNPRFLIMGFDLSEEVFHEVMMPDCMLDNSGGVDFRRTANFHLFTCGESLAVLWFRDTFKEMEIWVMREFGVRESWTQLSTISLQCVTYTRGLQITGLVVTKDAHILFSVAPYEDGTGRIFSHDLKSQETEEIIKETEQTFFFLGDYVESLALLDKGNDLRRHFEIESGNDDDTSINDLSRSAVCAMCSSSFVARSGTAA